MLELHWHNKTQNLFLSKKKLLEMCREKYDKIITLQWEIWINFFSVVCFLPGNSHGVWFYVPTFRDTLVCSIFIGT